MYDTRKVKGFSNESWNEVHTGEWELNSFSNFAEIVIFTMTSRKILTAVAKSNKTEKRYQHNMQQKLDQEQ